MNTPSGLRYTRSHEWVRMESDVATVGITDHAQCELGDVVFVELPKVGRKLEPDDPFGLVESVKAVSDLYSPIFGEVVAINEALNDGTDVVNTDPYGAGWMVQIRCSDLNHAESLMDAASYEAFVAEEASH